MEPNDAPTAPAPVPMSRSNAPQPFLVKTYDMVDDPSTGNVVSWSSTNNSFIVHDLRKFEENLLSKYFKHNSFSSFVRQLNKYGFRKVNPDRWEYANEGFLRGQKHLLETIVLRKPASGHTQQTQLQTSSVGACVEVGKFGLEEEIERLKRDKNVLMQELVRLRQQQQTTDKQMQLMAQRLQDMEQTQQQMMSFLAKAVNNPSFLSHFVQHKNETTKLIKEGCKKRRLKQNGVVSIGHNESPHSQIVKYQPMITLGNSSPALETFSEGSGPGVTVQGQLFLPEVTGDQFPPLEANSDVVATSPLADGQEFSYIPDDVDMVSNDPFIGPNMVPSHIEVVATSPLADGQEFSYIPDDVDMVPNDAFIGPCMVPSDIESFLFNDEDWNSNLLVEMDKYIPGLEQLCDELIQPNPEVDTIQDMDSVAPFDDYLMQGSEDKPLENASPTGQVQQLTQQMGLAPVFVY
ncbi:Heat shock factor (HSF)-type, DNA-binding [Artemisia annua]|uniref:Heat shock factor (HSF)-type, DNA-binding n=1 Tax=Artemisia annua TaxID=35608 RepID=A0A2U1M1K1_ARTAN|nr:Heat shock factor (HSF)-type, DNA-binding [Artemisia annua]